jgi:hypothetical protein
MPKIVYTLHDVKKLIAEENQVDIKSVKVVRYGCISITNGMHGYDIDDSGDIFEVTK